MKFTTTERGKERLMTCRCGHKRSAHTKFSQVISKNEVPLPTHWTIHKHIDQNTFGEGQEFSNLEELGKEDLQRFQDLFDETYRNIWTRDRKKHNPQRSQVPKGYKVTGALRCENSRFWREYAVRKAEIVQDRSVSDLKNFVSYTNVKSANAWAASGWDSERLNADCNEWYLFHGTSRQNATNICHNDFKLSLAGGVTGTLYGRGAYLAESITKADEYAKPDAHGEYTVILCRVLGGRVKYTDEEAPDTEQLVRLCIEGPYDCILGDREKIRNTFREFVFYDSENLYAEYIIHYRRLF